MTLDPKPALVVIDLQKGFLSLPTLRPVAEVVATAASLARAFRDNDLPVVLVTVSSAPSGRTDEPSPIRSFPAGWDELVDELSGHPGDHRMVKRTRRVRRHDAGRASALAGGDADRARRNSSSAGVEATGRHGCDLGFNVAFAADAITDRSAEMHDHSLARTFPRIGEITSAAKIVAMLRERPTWA